MTTDVSSVVEKATLRLRNLAGAKQQCAGDGGSVIALKHRVVALLGSKRSPQGSGIVFSVEVVIVPGEAEHTHSCAHQNKTRQ